MTSNESTSVDTTNQKPFKPSKPGTSVQLRGVVCQETDGILVVNVKWRGQNFVGALMSQDKFDCARITGTSPKESDFLVTRSSKYSKCSAEEKKPKKKRNSREEAVEPAHEEKKPKIETVAESIEQPQNNPIIDLSVEENIAEVPTTNVSFSDMFQFPPVPHYQDTLYNHLQPTYEDQVFRPMFVSADPLLRWQRPFSSYLEQCSRPEFSWNQHHLHYPVPRVEYPGTPLRVVEMDEVFPI